MAAACVAVALVSCGAQQSGAPDTDGPTFVSLNPCLDAILIEMADREQILALSHYSRDNGTVPPDFTDDMMFIGGTAEEVIALQPDIVLASTFLAPQTRAALERSGLRVESFSSPTTVAASEAQVTKVAALVGRPDGAEGLLHRMKQKAVLPPQTSDDAPRLGEDIPPKSALLWQFSEIVPGERTLIAELMSDSGFTLHSKTLGLDQADHISLEEVLANPPEVLLIAGDSAGQSHPLLEQIDGVRVEYFDPELLYCGGPTIAKARERLIDIRQSLEGYRE